MPHDDHPGAILIKNARVIDPASNRDETTSILTIGNHIERITPKPDIPQGCRVIDAEGLIAAPGLIDPHVHLREPGGEPAETIETGARAAAAGGFTTVCCMPNTRPALDTPELVRFVLDKAASADCRVFPVAAATKGREGERPTEIRLMAAEGAVAFSDDGDVIASAGVMLDVLKRCASVDRVFMQHCQEPTLTRGASMHAGSVSTELGLTGWPRIAEEIIIERDIRLAADAGARYHVQHMSSGASVELIRAARSRGLSVSAEASPHHLMLTHEACRGFNTATKMNPPLREQSDIDALRQGVAEGVITILATDHAPHTPESKEKDFASAAFGIIGLESALSLYAEALVESGAIGWPRLIEIMTSEPASLCGLDAHGLGALTERGPADLTLIDPEDRWTLSEAELAGRSVNTPFLGRDLKSRAVLTVCRGRVTCDRLDPSR